jgi:hypothetical protein
LKFGTAPSSASLPMPVGPFLPHQAPVPGQQGARRHDPVQPQALAGQLAWIAEKFGEWTDRGLPDEAVGRDPLLTNVMMYWLTGTAGSSARLYYEAVRSGGWLSPAPSATPTGVAVFPGTSRHRSAASPNCRTRSCTGANSTAAGTSSPWRPLTSWSVTCARSSGN